MAYQADSATIPLSGSADRKSSFVPCVTSTGPRDENARVEGQSHIIPSRNLSATLSMPHTPVVKSPLSSSFTVQHPDVASPTRSDKHSAFDSENQIVKLGSQLEKVHIEWAENPSGVPIYLSRSAEIAAQDQKELSESTMLSRKQDVQPKTSTAAPGGETFAPIEGGVCDAELVIQDPDDPRRYVYEEPRAPTTSKFPTIRGMQPSSF